MESRFDSEEYWSDRLGERFDLQGVGHLEYPEHYNRWLYRRKRRVLGRALAGHRVGAALDLGSGTGWVVAQLRRLGASSVVGTDLTEVAVERLRAQDPVATFHRLDLSVDPLPVESSSIDTVTMIDVAYHLVVDDGLEHAVTEIARVLRPGGRAIISDGFAGATERPSAHVAFRSRRDWDQLLEPCQLTISRTLPYFKTLSLPRDSTARRSWHPRIRGPVEWAMDTTLPLRPWLRVAVITAGRS